MRPRIWACGSISGPAYRTGNPYLTGPGETELFFDEPRGLAGLEEAVRFCRTFEGRGGGLIRTMLAPDRIETCTEALLRGTAAAGRELGVPVRLHCCQGGFELETVRRLHGRSPIEWLADLGFLTDRTLLPHGTHVTPSRHSPGPGDDLALIRDHGSVVVHCPLVAARFGEALASFRRYRALGIRIGLGDRYRATGPCRRHADRRRAVPRDGGRRRRHAVPRTISTRRHWAGPMHSAARIWAGSSRAPAPTWSCSTWACRTSTR